MNQVAISPKEAVQLGAQRLLSFGRIFLPRTFRQASPAFHEEIARDLYGPARFLAFEVFRDGAKTSLLRTFTLQRVSYAISRTIMYVSVSQAHAINSVRWIKRHVEFNKNLAIFQLSKGSKWTDEIIEIQHGIDDIPITVMAMGITGQIRGFNLDDYRPDLIIADDILNEENTATEDQRNKIENLFFGALINSLTPSSEAPFAKAVLLQTPLNRQDLVEKCMEDPEWHGKRFGCFDGEGKSRWEERYPTEVLLKAKEAHIRRRQYALWMREKECQIVSGEDKAFDITRLQYWDVLPQAMTVVISIDPASSDNPKADYNVVMAVGFFGSDVYVLDYYAERGVMPDKVAARFFELIWRFKPRKVVVESIAYQRVLKWYLEQEMLKHKTFVPVDAVQDSRRKADRILQNLPGLVHMGCLYVKASMTDLIDQMDTYNPLDKSQHDDLLDALAMADTSMNPALREIEGDYEEIEDAEYERLEVVACP